MKKVSVNELTVNAYYSKNLYLDEDFVLLSPDNSVGQDMINRLRTWGIGEILTDGEVVSKPALDLSGMGAEEGPGAFLEKKVQESENMKSARSFYAEALRFAQKVYDRFQKESLINIVDITDRVKVMMDNIRQNRDFMLRFDAFDEAGYSYVIQHAVRCTVLAIALGDQFKFPPYKLIELGIAAFLHEIGIVKFPEQLYLAEGVLNIQDRKNITAHPLVAYQSLKNVATPPAVLLAVLEHHERMNGKGYPRQLTGDKISAYGKIIALVCTYESAISSRPYKEASDPHEFMLELLKDKGQNYDENIVRALVFLLSVFPIGSFVEMSNKAKGMVIASNPTDPRYPIVRLLTDPEGSRLKDPIVFTTKKDNPVQIIRRIAKAEAAGLPVDV